MNNVCEKLEEIESLTECQQPTFKDILVELNRLQLENKCLKADNKELQKENMQLKNDNMILHNRLNVENNDDPSLLGEYEEDYLCGCETEEDLKAYEKAFDNMSLKK